jgi:prepilin-type N-terminal cleavage/methylation domain-containing protein
MEKTDINFRTKIHFKGFTLIELLIVVAIISVLVSLTVISYSAAQKQARDARRKSDLNQYRTGLEAFSNQNNGLYPVSIVCDEAHDVCGSELSVYMSACIEDPNEDSDYYYCSNSTGSQYILWGELETGGYWEACSDGRSGKLTDLPFALGDDCGGANCGL